MLTTLPPPCAVVIKSGNLNFLEPSGPLQACNGTALPLFGNIGLIPVRYLVASRLLACKRFHLWGFHGLLKLILGVPS